jgi:hypothetical protein
MHLANPSFIFGLIGIALPILIYLFTRQRVRQVAFSTLRFFAGASSILTRRKKTSEMILLAMRVLACALLAVAFARPFLAKNDPTQAGVVRAAYARAIVADLSASMNRGDLAAQVRQGVLVSLQDLPSSAAVTLIGFDRSASVLVMPGTDLDVVRRAAEALTPGHGGTNIAVGIRKAQEALDGITAPRKEIICISDLQRSGWESFRGDWNLPPGVKLTMRKLEPAASDPLTIQAADCPQSVVAENVARALTVRVANASKTPAVDVPVTLTLDGKVVQTLKLSVPAQGLATARFRHTFATAGDNAGAIAVGKGESPERVYYFNTRVIPRIRVLVLSDSAGEAASADSAFFLRMALAPSPDSPFIAELAKPAAVTATQLQQAAVVILDDVAALSGQTRAALSNVLARGGGLLFLPGSRTQADAFNAAFGDMAPAKLRRVLGVSSRSGDAKALVGKIDYEHPVFEVFQRPNYGDFGAVSFLQFWEVGDSQLSRVPARFTDGRPMLLEKSIGGGLSMMMVSPVDLKWNNLPLRAIFLPYLHQVVKHMSSRSEARTAFVVGDSLVVDKGCSLRDPQGKALEGQTVVVKAAGLYQVLDDKAKPVFTYAVNQELGEGDAATIEPAQVVAALQRDAAGVVAAAAAGGLDVVPEGMRREVWAYLIGGLTVLLLGELLLANRTAEQ